MSELAQLQAAFSAALGDTRSAAVSPAGLRGEAALVARRFALYRNNVRLARMNALGGAYPVTRNIVGAEFFTGLAREYAISHASNSGDLNEYGADLGDFLSGFAPAMALPYLAEVARLEWRVHRAYYAADAQPFELTRLAAIPETEWAGLRLRLHPAASVACFEWPVARIWAINQPHYTGAMEVDLRPRPSYALIHRPAYDVAVLPLEAGGHAFLDALARAQPLGEALLAASAAQADFEPGAALQDLVLRGLISDLYIEPLEEISP